MTFLQWCRRCCSGRSRSCRVVPGHRREQPPEPYGNSDRHNRYRCTAPRVRTASQRGQDRPCRERRDQKRDHGETGRGDTETEGAGSWGIDARLNVGFAVDPRLGLRVQLPHTHRRQQDFSAGVARKNQSDGTCQDGAGLDRGLPRYDSLVEIDDGVARAGGFGEHARARELEIDLCVRGGLGTAVPHGQRQCDEARRRRAGQVRWRLLMWKNQARRLAARDRP